MCISHLSVKIGGLGRGASTPFPLLIENNTTMAAHKKYFTEEERLQARRETKKDWKKHTKRK